MPERLEIMMPGSAGELPSTLWSDLEVESHLDLTIWLLEEAGADFSKPDIGNALSTVRLDFESDTKEAQIKSNP